MSVTFLDLQPEPLPIGLELSVQGRNIRTDDIRRITELAVTVSLVVPQIGAHGRFRFRTKGHGIFLVETADRAHRVGSEVCIADVVYAWIVDEGVVESRLEPRATGGKMNSRLLVPIDVTGQSFDQLAGENDPRGDGLDRIAVGPDDARIRVSLEQRLQARSMKALQNPVLLRSAELTLLQHHPVYAVLRARIEGQAADIHAHRHSPPGRWSHDAEVECPGALTLRKSVTEHVVVRMADEPLRDTL